MLLGLLVLFLGITLLVACATYLIYWYEESNRPDGPTTGTPVRLTTILRGLGSAVISQCLICATYPLALLRLRRVPRRAIQTTAGNPPILFIHGIFHNATAWLAYHRWFHQHGFTHTFCYSYALAGKTFPELVDHLEREIAALEAACPGTRPLLVGHSMGGLLARAWMARAGNQARIQGVVTLGTPHRGSKLAGLGPTKLSRELRFHGEIIRTLQVAEFSPDIPCYSLSSPLDNMVIPQEGLHIPVPGWQEERTPAVCHIAMLYHRETALRAIAAARAIVEENQEPQHPVL